MKLNLGAGYVTPKNWVNVDVKPSNDDVMYANVLYPLPFPNEHFDLIFANHVLHMFSWYQLNQALFNILDALKSGGVFRIIDMDPVKAFNNYLEDNKKGLIIPDDVETSLDGKFCNYLTWYSTRKSIATPEYMIELLLRAGFSKAKISEFGECELDSRENESYVVEGVK